jgi:tetratricopeptide (TPR) repeat protein
VGDVEKAISSLESLLRKTPGYPPAMGELATAYCVEDKSEKAIQYIDKIKKMGFDCVDYLYKRAKRFISVNRTDYAVKLLAVAVESNNANRDTLLLLSECLKGSAGVNAFGGAESKTMHGTAMGPLFS